MHSTFSDGELTPEQLATAARVFGLDFIAATEHNSVAAHAAWREWASDDLLVVMGEEVTTTNGHWLALGLPPGLLIDWRHDHDAAIRPRVQDVHRVGGLCVVAHPHAPYPSGEFAYDQRGFDAVEVWNGLWSSDRPWNADNAAALTDWERGLVADREDGRFQPAVGNSDTHLAGQIGVPHTVVFAADFTTTEILNGLRSGRSWIAARADLDISLRVSANTRSAGIGERLEQRDDPLTLRFTARGAPSGTLTIHSVRGEIYRRVLPESGHVDATWKPEPADHGFVRLELRDTNGQMAALTNPILIT